MPFLTVSCCFIEDLNPSCGIQLSVNNIIITIEFTYGPTCTDIASQFPDAGEVRPHGDERILCPFLRLMHRAGAVPGAEDGDAFNATVASVTGSAAALGACRL